MRKAPQAVAVSPGRPRGGIGDRLLRLLSHPLRIEVMRVLHNRVASPKELAEELDEKLGNVSYHVKYLRNARCIEILDTAPRRGAIEHYYQSNPGQAIAGGAFRDFVAEAVRALNAGTFDAEDGHSLCWTPMDLDDEGQRELAEHQAAWSEELRRIKAEATERLAGEREPSTRRFVAGTVGFETPPGPGFTGTSVER
jgi:DNA-binding transcriptional ArsR family regulator